MNRTVVNRFRGISISYDEKGYIVKLVTPYGDTEPFNKPIKELK